jgi:hypothetical protein
MSDYKVVIRCLVDRESTSGPQVLYCLENELDISIH